MVSGLAPEQIGVEPRVDTDKEWLTYISTAMLLNGVEINPKASLDTVVALAAHVPGVLSVERYNAWRRSSGLRMVPMPVGNQLANNLPTDIETNPLTAMHFGVKAMMSLVSTTVKVKEAK